MLRRPSSTSNLVLTRFIRPLSPVVFELRPMSGRTFLKLILRENEFLEHPAAHFHAVLLANQLAVVTLVSPGTDADYGSRAEDVDDPAGRPRSKMVDYEPNRDGHHGDDCNEQAFVQLHNTSPYRLCTRKFARRKHQHSCKLHLSTR